MTDHPNQKQNLSKFSRRVSGKHVKPVGNLRKIGDGLNGIIFKEEKTNHAIKIYRDSSTERSPTQLKKIEAMIENRPAKIISQENGYSFVRLAWPDAIVWDNRNEFVGFSMPLFQDARSYSLRDLLSPKDRHRHGIQSSPTHRVIVAFNLAVVVNNLHSVGHHIVDLKPDNLKVYGKTGYVGILDCDGFSIKSKDGTRYATTVATDGYMAPETRGKPENFNENQDRFALAVIIFQLLSEGLHPYKGRPRPQFQVPDSEQERIDQNICPCGTKPDSRLAPHAQSFHQYFEHETRLLFDRAFLSSTKRPSPQEWCDHFKLLLPSGSLALKTCAKNADHFVSSKGCAHCDIAKNTGFEVGTGKRFEHQPNKTSPKPTSKSPTPSAASSGPPHSSASANTNAQPSLSRQSRKANTKPWLLLAAIIVVALVYVSSDNKSVPGQTKNRVPATAKVEKQSTTAEQQNTPKTIPAEMEFFSSLGERSLCGLALNKKRDDWESMASNQLLRGAVQEARKRGYSINSCRDSLGKGKNDPKPVESLTKPIPESESPEERFARNQSDETLCLNVYGKERSILVDLYGEKLANAFIVEADMRGVNSVRCNIPSAANATRPELVADEQGYVCNSALTYANLRNGPHATKYRVLQKVQNGESVTILEQQSANIKSKNWLNVRLANGTEGWISASMIANTPCGIY